ncbi:MAG TPA: ATP synthase F1 subunit delta [Terriglobales bacterium]|nr:ATP synthase F1 subunit delta [Terriglobales bacterium]
MAAVSSRYARAMADVVVTNKLDAGKTTVDLEQMSETLNASADLRNIWESPSVPSPQKLKLLDAVGAQAGVSKQVRNFLAVLIDQRRIGLLVEITALLKAELNERMGFAEAQVTSARELSADERATLEAEVAKATGKTIRAKYSQDAQVLGGAVVRVGSTIYDGSVRGKLKKIKQQMMS